jgi:hypothetical protein
VARTAPHVAHAPALSVAQVRALRQHSLLLGADGAGARSLAGVVTWLGALQAQDLGSGMWSLGIRTGATRAEVGEVLASGAILRTWPMRGTLHLVPAADARWMLTHLGQRTLDRAGPRRAALGLDQALADRAADVLGAFLADGQPRRRSDCLAALGTAGIDTAGQRGYHLLWHAAARGIVCVGPNLGREQSFVLLDAWAPAPVDLDRPAALATVAERFVRGRGPVSEHDLARWADLTVTDARAALAAVPGLAPCTDARGRRLLVAESALDAVPADALPARAVPGFDELVLGYRDRTAQLDRGHEPLVVPGGNGMFSATLLHEGRVVGTWRRRALARSVSITATPFLPLPARAVRSLERALHAYAEHLGLPASISWAEPLGGAS